MGWETADDAAVYLLPDGQAIVSTVDFITPVVDDPCDFGAVAAANSLSDVYAMGGRPIMALNLCGFPENELPTEVIGEILRGAAEVCRQAGVAMAGGHTVRDAEVKFGLAVTGLVDPALMLRNCTARPGDALLLTKPLGTGALAAALKKGALPADGEHARALIATMRALNSCGPALAAAGAHAATDVTGFGFTGHALEMATGSGVRLEVEMAALPLLPDAVSLCGEGHTCGGTKSNHGYTRDRIAYDESLDDASRGLLNDPQTSGGLLIAVPGDRIEEFRDLALELGASCAAYIGSVHEHSPGEPHLIIR